MRRKFSFNNISSNDNSQDESAELITKERKNTKVTAQTTKKKTDVLDYSSEDEAGYTFGSPGQLQKQLANDLISIEPPRSTFQFNRD